VVTLLKAPPCPFRFLTSYTSVDKVVVDGVIDTADARLQTKLTDIDKILHKLGLFGDGYIHYQSGCMEAMPKDIQDIWPKKRWHRKIMNESYLSQEAKDEKL
jgi:hypothetical protein